MKVYIRTHYIEKSDGSVGGGWINDYAEQFVMKYIEQVAQMIESQGREYSHYKQNLIFVQLTKERETSASSKNTRRPGTGNIPGEKELGCTLTYMQLYIRTHCVEKPDDSVGGGWINDYAEQFVIKYNEQVAKMIKSQGWELSHDEQNLLFVQLTKEGEKFASSRSTRRPGTDNIPGEKELGHIPTYMQVYIRTHYVEKPDGSVGGRWINDYAEQFVMKYNEQVAQMIESQGRELFHDEQNLFFVQLTKEGEISASSRSTRRPGTGNIPRKKELGYTPTYMQVYIRTHYVEKPDGSVGGGWINDYAVQFVMKYNEQVAQMIESRGRELSPNEQNLLFVHLTKEGETSASSRSTRRPGIDNIPGIYEDNTCSVKFGVSIDWEKFVGEVQELKTTNEELRGMLSKLQDEMSGAFTNVEAGARRIMICFMSYS